MTHYNWQLAQVEDIEDMFTLSTEHFAMETTGIFNIDKLVSFRNINLGIVNQYYNPVSEMLVVLRGDNHKLIAWTWIKRNVTVSWTDEEMAFINMVHIDQTLHSRVKIQIVKDMMSMWEDWCNHAKINIIVSTTMREQQSAFLKLHARNGYIIHGASAYKRLSALQTGLPIP
jgi:hypothetical protein